MLMQGTITTTKRGISGYLTGTVSFCGTKDLYEILAPFTATGASNAGGVQKLRIPIGREVSNSDDLLNNCPSTGPRRCAGRIRSVIKMSIDVAYAECGSLPVTYMLHEASDIAHSLCNS